VVVTATGARASDIAFFPLLPFAIKALSLVSFLPATVAGIVISGVSGASATMAVTRLARTSHNATIARRAGIAFSLLPGSFVFSWIYCEGLLITLSAVALLFLLQRRWWLAGLTTCLATLTSPMALALAPAALAAWVSAPSRERARATVPVIAAPVTALAWIGWIGLHAHNLNAWRLVERGGWKSAPSLRFPFHIVANFLFDPARPNLTDHLLFWGVVASVLGVWWLISSRTPAPLTMYTIASLGLAAVSYPIGPRPRFLTIAFPLAVGIAAANTGRRFRVIVLISALWLALMSFETLMSWAIFP
jgi:hypothetical protein